MKKVICYSLSVLLIVTLFVGCTPTQSETFGTTEPSTTIPTAPAKPTDPEPTDPAPTDPEPTDPAPTDPEPTEPTNPAQPQNLNFTYQCINTWPCLDSTCGEPKLYVIDSSAALETYCLEKASHVDETNFADAIVAYNEDYFSEHTLIIISLEEAYQPIYFEVCEIVIQSDGTGVLYLKKMRPEWVNSGSAGWHILVDVEGKLPEGTQFTLEIEEAPYEYDA